MDTEYKRIRRFNKFLTTKKISGGIRYLLAPIKSKKGPVLMASETVGISNTQSDFIFYKYETPYVPPTPPTPKTATLDSESFFMASPPSSNCVLEN